MKPILLTQGDPFGIGPEVILKALMKHRISPIIIGSVKVFEHYCKALSLPQVIKPLKSISDYNDRISDHLHILDIPFNSDITVGKLSKEAGKHALESLDMAISLLQNDESHCLVNAPVSKEAINMTLPSFFGHTEYLAQKCGIPKVHMMLAGPKMKVITVTTHVPIKDLPNAFSQDDVYKAIVAAHHYLTLTRDPVQKIAVTGFNPHAGEGGILGTEEVDRIIPAIKEAQADGIDVEGPFAADSLFNTVYENRYGLYISMFHDQGLTPLKLLSFGKSVNITLGLPFFRISVDHGTAFPIAGKGEADEGSMIEALSIAERVNQSL